MEYYLKPILPNIPSILNNRQDITKRHYNPTRCYLTIDNSNLYLNIPQNEGTKARLDALDHFLKNIWPNLVLKEDTFIFHTFKQIRDTALRTKMAPSYAKSFMRVLEQNFLTT